MANEVIEDDKGNNDLENKLIKSRQPDEDNYGTTVYPSDVENEYNSDSDNHQLDAITPRDSLETPVDESQPFRYEITENNPYIESLNEVLEYTQLVYSHLFTENELDQITTFRKLSPHAKYLYVRFLVRKFKCLRPQDYSKYLPEENLQSALDELVDHDYFHSHHHLNLSELLFSLNSKELILLMKDFKIKLKSSIPTLSRTNNKILIVDTIVQSITQQRTVSNSSPLTAKLKVKMESLYGSMYKINGDIAAIFKTMIQTYLIPGYGEFDMITRSKMNILKFPIYEFTPTSLFDSRQSLDEYLTSLQYEVELEKFPQWSKEKRDLFLDEAIGRAEVAVLLQETDQLKPLYLRRYTPNWVYMNSLLRLSELIRPIEDYSHEFEWNCLSIFTTQKTYRPEKRILYLTRKIHIELLLFKEQETPTHDWLSLALTDCLDAISDSTIDNITRQDLYRKAFKVFKTYESQRLNFPKEIILEIKQDLSPATFIEISAPQDVNRPIKANSSPISTITTTNRTIEGTTPTIVTPRGSKTQWFDPGDTDKRISVEEVALNHYFDQGWKGYHSESRILNSLFGLLFCDIFFQDKTKLYHPYQTGPLDLRSGDSIFYTSRKESIESRLNSISTNHPSFSITFISDVYDREFPTQTAIAGVNWKYELEDILQLVECLPSQTLLKICQLHCENYRTYSSGGPDLCLWHPILRQCKFVEVKSENDVLSDNQRVWIHNLIQTGVQVELCKVLSDKKPSKKRKLPS